MLVILNSHFYRQHFNKIKLIWRPKLRIRVYNSHFLWVLVCICCVGQYMKIHQNAQSRRCIQAKQQASPSKLHTWARTPAWEPSKSSQQPTRATWWREGQPRGAVQAHHPHLRSAPCCSSNAINSPGGGCKRFLLKYLSKSTIFKL